MFQWPIFCILLNFFSPTTSAFLGGRLTVHQHTNVGAKLANAQDYKTYYYRQTLDHFNYGPQSYATFNQRYVMNSRYWGGPGSNAPIFALLGEESPIDSDVAGVGFLPDNAPAFKALMVYIEHRFYGDSVPFGSVENAMRNEDTRGYFNSAQALADYAEVLMYIKQALNAMDSPIIVVGGSYGGMLASWFRLKYPHIALGALASSAPILLFNNITPQDGYYSIISKDFREASRSCYDTIRKSWSEIDEIASWPNGLLILSQRFSTCRMLDSASELKEVLINIYNGAAQYDHPPAYPVSVLCGGVDGAPDGTDILGRVFAGLVAYMGRRQCYDISKPGYPTGWGWQTCSEMVMPRGVTSEDSMFQPSPFNLNSFINECENTYGIPPRPNWISSYYGGQDIKLVLRRFASNIIFSNGLRDPYSSGGVLENISESVLAISTKNGSHCLDLHPAREDDPEWLVTQRKTEIDVIQGWLKNYDADLKDSHN